MEAIIDLLQAFHLNFLEVLIAAFFVFGIGFFLGNKKSKKLIEEVYKLQRDILDLNAEVLYGKEEKTVSETKIIGIKHDTLKGVTKFAQ
jgi:hypothetical protein